MPRAYLVPIHIFRFSRPKSHARTTGCRWSSSTSLLPREISDQDSISALPKETGLIGRPFSFQYQSLRIKSNLSWAFAGAIHFLEISNTWKAKRSLRSILRIEIDTGKHYKKPIQNGDLIELIRDYQRWIRDFLPAYPRYSSNSISKPSGSSTKAILVLPLGVSPGPQLKS